VASLLTAGVVAAATAGQAPTALAPVALAPVALAPQGGQSTAVSPAPLPQRVYPAPTNLKVLPKDLTGQQVHDVMKQWAGSLGVECDSCHAEDRENVGPDGRPHLKFADDSKPMKAVARTMYTMTEEINSNYVSRIESSGDPVTCGTCHRGHLGPEPFVIPSNEGAPPPQGAQPPEEKPLSQ